MDIALLPVFSTVWTGSLIYLLNGGSPFPSGWFGLHTNLNLLAVALLFPVGLYIQKQRQLGKIRTWIHLFCMTSGVLCLGGGGLCIWMLKEEMKWNHFTTWHSWLGAGVATLLTLQVVASLAGPMAPWGSGKFSASDALIHAAAGGISYLLSIVTVFFSWFTRKSASKDLVSIENVIFVGGFLVTMVFIIIASIHSEEYKKKAVKERKE